MLRQGKFKRLYFLEDSHPFEFFEEAYSHSNYMYLTLGYFSGSAFGVGVNGLMNFISNGGMMRILCNDKLYEQDINAITKGYKKRENRQLSENALLYYIRNANKIESFGFKCLSFLIQANRLDIKIVQSSRLVHYKLGIFSDTEGNQILFNGSVNYTISGLLYNKEQIQITKSWDSNEDEVFINNTHSRMEDLWNGNIDDVIPIPTEDIKKLFAQNVPKLSIDELKNEYKILSEKFRLIKMSTPPKKDLFFTFPKGYSPRSYQIDAIGHWVENDYKSILSMATGTGKTLTSLFAANALIESNAKSITTILIIVPLKDLIDQWEEDIEKSFHGDTIKIYSKNPKWKKRLSSTFMTSRLSNTKRVIICTYSSYGRHVDTILSLINIDKTLLISDEVHKIGTESLSDKLPIKIKYRLGLSATPVREYDEEGTDRIINYFSPNGPLFEITISDAIRLGVLCKYYYYPIICELNIDELKLYKYYSDIIKKKSFDQESNKDDIGKLLKQRHRIIEQAQNKYSALNDLLLNEVEAEKLIKSVFYVPEGKNDDGPIIDMYMNLLCNTHKIKMSEYTEGSDIQILDDFRKGHIDSIAAKKKMDEGVNIPEIQTAFFLASSTVEREFIQRRGRILRKCQGKDFAYIYDFLVVPSISINLILDHTSTRSIIRSEYKRASIFAESAINSYEALKKINKYMTI